MSSVSQWTREFKSAIVASQAVMALLSAAAVERRCREARHSWRASFWSPANTLVAFLFQTLNASKTLRAAVADMLDVVLSRGVDPTEVDPQLRADARGVRATARGDEPAHGADDAHAARLPQQGDLRS